MSKIQEMIDRICPGGVEYKKIKDVFTRIKGTPITATLMKEIASEEGDVRIFAGGKTVIDAKRESIPNANITTIPSLIVQSRGVIDFVFYDKPFTFKNEMWGYTHQEPISVKFLGYVLKNNVEYFRRKASETGSLPQISLPVTEEYEIPVPPLEVQREIVKVLDSFSEHTAALVTELDAELAARKKQYEYYRDNLLSFEGRNDVPWHKLASVCNVRRGIRVVKKQLKDSGNYPVFQNSIAPMGYYDQYNRDGNMPYVICAGSSSGSVGYCYSPFWAADDCYTIESECLNERFVYFAMKRNNQELFHQVRKGSMPRLSHTAIDSMLVPVPPLEEQVRIVSILDKLELLINDLSDSLPAEIKARQQQYEYYRDQLLTFKRAN